MSGLELELMAMPTPGLFLQFSYAYLDSELDDVLNPFTGETEMFEFTNAPEHTYSLVADYTFAPSSFGVLNGNISYNYIDDRQEETQYRFRKSYGLLNARLALGEAGGLGGEWTIAAWGKNLGDTDYEAFTLDNLPQASRAIIWGDGRSYGVDVIYRYR